MSYYSKKHYKHTKWAQQAQHEARRTITDDTPYDPGSEYQSTIQKNLVQMRVTVVIAKHLEHLPANDTP